VVSAIVFEAPPKLSEACPDAPEGLEFLLNRALEKDVARRLQNAGELKQAVSLCRMTLGMAPGPSPAAAPVDTPTARNDAAVTKIMRTPDAAAAAPPPPSEDASKTRVLRKPAADEPAGEVKTRALPRMSPPKPVVPPPAPPAAAKTPKRVVRAAEAAPQLSYCPSCTFANPAGSAVCQRCQTPFAAPPPAAAAAPKSSQLPLYIAIGVAALLAIVLIVVLVMK
jgi:serine/threonine-protein kinase